MVVDIDRGVRGHHGGVRRSHRGGAVMEWVGIAALGVVVALAMFVVPLVARRVERESYRLPPPPERFGWFHEHVDHQRKEPKRARPRPREGESEGDLWK